MIDYTEKLLYTVISLIISTGLHFAMWMAADHFKMRSFDSKRTVNMRTTHLDVIDMKVTPRPDESKHSIDLSNIISQQKELLKKLFEKEGLVELPQPSHLPRSKNSARYRINAKPWGGSKQTFPLSMLPQDLLAIKAKSTALKRRPKKRHLTPRIKHRQNFKLVPSSIPKLTVDTPAMSNAVFQAEIKKRMVPNESDVAKASPIARNVPELVTMTKTKRPQQKMKILDSALSATASLYEDPKTEESFFRIEITFNDDKPVSSVPKDILFLQDASSSISFSKLEKFKKGIKLGLDYLSNPDSYNIVTFRDKPKPLFSGLVSATPENLHKAKRFIDKISSSGKTDIYSGLTPYVSTPRSQPNRPFLILLVSDGRTTTGLKLKDRELIRRIIRENNTGVSIFSFSSGTKANVFLMDFLSYMNRGISLHIEKKDDAPHHLATFVAMLSNIIVADLTYKITGRLQAEIYPKQLPHLFRKHPLVLYGKLTPDTKEVAIQIIGKDKDGKKEELIKRISLSTASPAGPELVQRWALQKIYHLLGENIRDNSTNFDTQIHQLALKYNINIPY